MHWSDHQGSNRQKHTIGGIPRWSPTLVLVARFSACVWQSGRDAQFSLTYGRVLGVEGRSTWYLDACDVVLDIPFPGPLPTYAREKRGPDAAMSRKDGVAETFPELYNLLPTRT
jgi:hypothetical protein